MKVSFSVYYHSTVILVGNQGTFTQLFFFFSLRAEEKIILFKNECPVEGSCILKKKMEHRDVKSHKLSSKG